MAGGLEDTDETPDPQVVIALGHMPPDAILISATGKVYSHDLEALHAFAKKIGAEEYWRAPPHTRWPGYQLPDDPAWRVKAFRAGALPACKSTIIAIANCCRRSYELAERRGLA